MRGVEMLRRCPVGGEQAQDTQPLLGGQLACWLNHFLNKWICWATWSSSGYREQYGSTHKATVSMDKLFELNFAQFATKKPPNIKVVACLLAPAVADPLGAGAVGDGCELQKVSKEEEKECVFS